MRFRNRVKEMADASTEAIVEIHSEYGHTYDRTVSHNLTHPNNLI
jgi:hypothetical protein